LGSLRLTRAHLVRAVLESVAFNLPDSFTIFREMNLPLEQVRLGGGRARSSQWHHIWPMYIDAQWKF